ncbi:hypothetical protein [Streptomyces sp. NPDC048521]|uniref:hypothetical protein n=1 Tax=Streptomyces sp. NPDC048521 TaxID=3365566 RepID=UPI0037121D09
MSAETPTPTTSHLAPLAAALHEATDSESLARIFAELADESLALCDTAPSEELWAFWLRLNESFYGDMLAMRQPPKPKRRWFR